MKKILSAAIVILVTLFTIAYFALADIGYQGSAYAAKNLCSGVFVSQLPADTVLQQAIIPASPPLALASYSIDRQNKLVKASLLGLYPRRAQFRSGLGCTLIPRDVGLLPPVALPSIANSVSNADVAVATRDDTASNTKLQGYDQQALSAAINFAFAENDERGHKNTKAVVIMYQGELIAERYADNVTAGTPLTGWSMTKSVVSLLCGIMVREGKLHLDAAVPVSEWQGDDRRLITLDQLLHMSSGLEFNETYGIATDVTQMLTAENDTGAFAAGKPLVYTPGTFWAYSSGTTNIISRMIQQQLGGSLEDLWAFTQEELFQPLGVTSAYFEPDPSGVFVGSSFLYMSARDWAKLGQLLLNKGHWLGREIVSADWVDYSITPAPANDNNDYGAHIWLNRDPDNDNRTRTWPDVPTSAFSMNGYQGQYVAVVPTHNLVVVRLGFTPLPARAGMNEFLQQVIAALPATIRR